MFTAGLALFCRAFFPAYPDGFVAFYGRVNLRDEAPVAICDYFSS